MKKYFHIFLKVLLTLLLVSPILGTLGVFPAPTRDLYTSDRAFAFIDILMKSYVMFGVAITCFLTLVCLWSRREALAMILILPVTANIIGFHTFLDGGLLSAGAIMGNMLLLMNIYFLWVYRSQYRSLLVSHKK